MGVKFFVFVVFLVSEVKTMIEKEKLVHIEANDPGDFDLESISGEIHESLKYFS